MKKKNTILEPYQWYHSVPKNFFVAVLVETRACCPRDACYPRCAWHLTPFYVPVSTCARSATCNACPMALVPDSTVHCSRPPAPPTHHDIVKQYRKGLTAVADRCVYIYPTIGTTLFRKVLFCCCSGRDSCMLTSRCMLPSLCPAPYPALCPC